MEKSKIIQLLKSQINSGSVLNPYNYDYSFYNQRSEKYANISFEELFSGEKIKYIKPFCNELETRKEKNGCFGSFLFGGKETVDEELFYEIHEAGFKISEENFKILIGTVWGEQIYTKTSTSHIDYSDPELIDGRKKETDVKYFIQFNNESSIFITQEEYDEIILFWESNLLKQSKLTELTSKVKNVCKTCENIEGLQTSVDKLDKLNSFLDNERNLEKLESFLIKVNGLL